MVERYRNHLIFVKAEQDPKTALWKAATHIQFNEDPVTFRDVSFLNNYFLAPLACPELR